MDHRPERRTRARLAQRLLEQGDRAVDALELGEEHERVGAQRPVPGLGQQLVAIVRARVHSPGGVMGARCGQRAP